MKYIVRLLLVILAFSINGFSQASANFILLTNVSGTTYTDHTCPDGDTCYYQVTSVDALGNESGPANCTSALCFNGNQAIGVIPGSGAHNVVLSWTASTTPSVTYNVYQRLTLTCNQ